MTHASIDCLLAACAGSKITFKNHKQLFDVIDRAAKSFAVVSHLFHAIGSKYNSELLV